MIEYKPLRVLKDDECARRAISKLVTAGYGQAEDSELGYITLWEKYGSGMTGHIQITDGDLDPIGNVFKLKGRPAKIIKRFCLIHQTSEFVVIRKIMKFFNHITSGATLNNILLIPLLWFVSSSAMAQQKTQAGRPNVIVIMADDMGAGMLSFYGQKYFSTPNIDRLANEGVVFANSFSSAYCAPSRASLLTGYSDCRKGKYVLTNAGIYKHTVLGKLTDEQAQRSVDAAIGTEPDIEYLPQVFKRAGYITGQVGKLDYGFATTSKQLKNHGWDYHYGYYDHIQSHGFYPMFLHENGNRISVKGNTHPDAGKTGEKGSDSLQERNRWDMNGKQVYSQDLFLQKALTFIRDNKDKPFFLYHPTQLPHGPVAIPAIHPELVFQTGLTDIEKAYASMVKRLDDDLGIIQQELSKLGIADNTIIIFSSDNGHELYTSFDGRVAKPYRNMGTGAAFDNVTNKFTSEVGGDIFNGNNGVAGLKTSNWNGGVKVPLFVYWPGHFKKGFVANQLVTNYDLLATIADLLKVPLKENKDGRSYLSVLKTGKGKVHDAIAFASFMGPALVTSDGWKLRYFAPKKIFQLFHLPDDYREEIDLSAKHPGKVEELTRILIEKCDGDINNGWFSESRNITRVNE